MRFRSRYGFAAVTVTASIIAIALPFAQGTGNAASVAHRNLNLDGASRTWISGVGDDANPCSRTAPCKTFAGGISKTAAGGEVDTLDPGGFGGLTITKAITIDGLGGNKSSVLVAGTNGITVNAGPNDVVTLRHLQIQGIGSGLDGIKFVRGKALILEDVVIEGFTGNGVNVSLSAAGSNLVIKDSIIQNSGQAGVAVSTTTGHVQATITGSELANNHDGLLAGSGASVDLGTSTVTMNTGIGAGCKTAGSIQCFLHLTRDQFDHNGTAISSVRGTGAAPSSVTISDNDVYGNTVGIATSGASVLSFGNNRVFDNTTNGTVSGTAIHQM